METQKNKLKLLEIRDLLLRETDDQHALSTQQIIDYLASKGIKSERKSIYHYMELLEEYGLDIITEKDKQNWYHIANRNFQLAELKLLVDAIHDAILGKYKLRFKYFDYDINKEVKYRKQGEYYSVIPVFLCWDDEKYYCVTYHEQHDDYVVYRVDKMREVSVLNVVHNYQNKPVEMEKFCDQLFNMYTGKEKKVTIRFDLDLLNVILDRFGIEVNIKLVDERWFEITEIVYVSPTFLSWVVQFQDKAKIIEPIEVIEEFKTTLEKALKNYE